jgi:hypothetical protein
VRELGDVARYASRLIDSQRFGDLSITLIGVAVDIGDCLTAGITDLISFDLKPGTSLETAQDLARHMRKHIVGLSVTK